MSGYVFPFRELWYSTRQLHKRFFVNNPPSFQARFDKFVEETNEFKEAMVLCENGESIQPNHSPVHEAADVIVTAMGLLQHLGYSYEDLEQAVSEVIHKNDAKTLETHAVNEWGLIAKRAKTG